MVRKFENVIKETGRVLRLQVAANLTIEETNQTIVARNETRAKIDRHCHGISTETSAAIRTVILYLRLILRFEMEATENLD